MKKVKPTPTKRHYQDFILYHSRWYARLIYPFVAFKRVYKDADKQGKTALILSTCLIGGGKLLYGLFESFVLGVLLSVAYLIYFISVGYQHLVGTISLSFFPMWSMPLVLFIGLLIYLYLTFTSTLFLVESLNEGGSVPPSPLLSWVRKMRQKITIQHKVIAHTYRQGTARTRRHLIVGYLLPFLPFYWRKQVIRGTTILLSLAAYLTFMIIQGGASLMNMIGLSNYIGDRRQPLVYGIIAVIFSVYMLYIYVNAQQQNVKAENALLNGRKVLTFREEVEQLKNKSAYQIMLFIPIIGALLFTVIPLVFMISLAFTNYNIATGVGINRFMWTGFESFKKLFDGGTNFAAFVNVFNWTMVWAFFATFTTYFGGFFLALLIAKKTVKWKKVYRSLFVIAMAIPQFVSLRVMYSMFHDYGPINAILTSMGGDRVLFWGDINTAKTLIILVNMWVGIPYFMLLISGLLLNIPKDYYEAAEIDGAGKWAIFRKITFPYILFSTTPLLITSFVGNINNFNVIWLLTNGGPMGQGTGGVAGGTDIFITWLYKLTMYNLNVAEYDIGAAIGIIMFIISSVISLVIFRNTGAYKKESEFRK